MYTHTNSTEHLGLIRPQMCQERHEEVTSFMRPAPFQNDDETCEQEDALVADPLSENTESLLNDTAKRNRDIFTEIFRPVPSNLVRNWKAYDVIFPSTAMSAFFMLIHLDSELRPQG